MVLSALLFVLTTYSQTSKTTIMKFQIPELHYAADGLEPLMSRSTIEYHYGKHLAAYINNLNTLVVGTEFEKDTAIQDIVLRSSGAIYNNAAQAWNHILFFNQLSPKPQAAPSGKLLAAIDRDFGSLEAFKEQFTKAATTLFGSGWVWLAADDAGKLSILAMGNAGNPVTEGLRPLMGIDVWEHAYYLDHQNRRADFIGNFWKLLDWKFVEKNYEV